jgi:hypothetical protein
MGRLVDGASYTAGAGSISRAVGLLNVHLEYCKKYFSNIGLLTWSQGQLMLVQKKYNHHCLINMR